MESNTISSYLAGGFDTSLRVCEHYTFTTDYLPLNCPSLSYLVYFYYFAQLSVCAIDLSSAFECCVIIMTRGWFTAVVICLLDVSLH